MYAQSSINKLEKVIAELEIKYKSAQIDERILEKKSLLAIAHFNLGCQQEFLKEY